MRTINCCVCLEDNVYHYTQEDIESKCEHPLCKNCYFQLNQQECPLCRIPISSLLLDIKKAIFHILNVRYEKLFGDVEYINILFGYFGIDILLIIKDSPVYEYSYIYKSQREEMDKYYYLHNKNIEKNINIEQKVCPHICA